MVLNLIHQSLFYRPFKNDRKKKRLSIECIKDFWGFFSFWFTFKIHNQCNPFGPMSEIFVIFKSCFIQLCLQCKCIHQAVWQAFFLKSCYYGFINLQYFWLFLGSWCSFPAPWHNPSNIHVFLINLIQPPLKLIKSF